MFASNTDGSGDCDQSLFYFTFFHSKMILGAGCEPSLLRHVIS